MTKEQTLEAIKVMQAYVDGKPVERICADGAYLKEKDPHWNWIDNIYEYRIKPQFTTEQQAIIDEWWNVSKTIQSTPYFIEDWSDIPGPGSIGHDGGGYDPKWDLLFNSGQYRVRIKPEPKKRLMRPEEFPVVWWVLLKPDNIETWHLVNAVSKCGFYIAHKWIKWDCINSVWSEKPFGTPRSFFVEVNE